MKSYDSVSAYPSVSIVIPIYNDGEYIARCLESIINQSLRNIEIICIDDFSTDNSREIIEFYAKQDSRIKVILHEKNSSAFVARKNGILASRGKYIMFVDGDDELADDACRIAFETISSQQVDMLQYETEVVNCAGVPDERIKSNKKLLKPYLSKLDNRDLVIECFKNKKFGFQLWNKIFNGDITREAIKDISNIYLPKAQDLYMFFLIAVKCKSYIGIDTELYKYNFGLGVTGGNTISLEKFSILCAEKDVADQLYNYIDNHCLYEKYIDIVDLIYKHFLNECVSRWENNVNSDERSQGFNCLVEKFGYSEIVKYYASKNWFNNIELANKLIGIDFLKSKKRTQKIQTIAAYYRCVENGGAQRVVAMLCNLWAEMQDENGNPLYKVVLIVDEKKGEMEYYVSPKVIREFLPDRTTAIKEKFIERYAAWQDIISRNKIDIVISSMWIDPCTFWDLLAVKGHPEKPSFCIHVHSFSLLPYSFNGLQGERQNKIYEICDGIVTLSDIDKTYISAFNETVFNILNPIHFNPHEIVRHKANANKILWLGRISSEKNPLHAIYMLKELVKIIPDVHLDIVGSGSSIIESSMLKLVESNNLNNNVTFHGFHLDVEKFYADSKLFICTSSYEGFSITMCEAMAHALPVITYDMPWLTLIRDGRGIITVKQGDYKSIANKAAILLKSPEKAEILGKNGYEQICDIYNHDISKDWYDFFGKVNENAGKIKLSEKYNEKIIYEYLLYYNTQKLKKEQPKIINKEIIKNKEHYIINKIIGGLICYIEHGTWYTIRRFFEKLKNKI